MHLTWKQRWLYFITTALSSILIVSACAPAATPPPVDMVGTLAQQMVSDMSTQTANAPTSTPLPPTVTATSSFTDTPTPEPTTSGPLKKPVVLEFAGCWYGPGPTYQLDSNIDTGKKVEILGIGSVPGWYIIRNPYFHKLCWIEAAKVRVDADMDLSGLPVMTPMP